MTYAFMADDPPPPRRRRRINWPVVGAVAVLAAVLAATFLRPASVSERQREDKTVRVVLPPPPPPPPPPEVAQEKPPEPTPTPMDQPVEDTPPPPDAPSEPTVGDSALTAREGAGPSNYGLARGDGSGTRIGGRPGGGDGGFGAYGELTRREVTQAVQGERDLSRGRYSAQLAVTVDTEGRITSVRLLRGTGDARRDAALQRALTGLRLSRRPPDGLPVMRIELNARSGA
ncbi:TonB C-terminal domain-containing protein [Brevundimonas pondensis]|uniref:TonB C-terminal domain-containing protein n=1 Tax=Brevundimonas pondensis TaxID=2774189 RepID=A0ABX7SPB7_9CAUL|nr:TonB C-terminal domain-containing protein [Brevundimonas pondensis]QTC88655.1 TonB C-terminal domain-containing protein [Brevundimonas pondensis]